MHCVVSFFATPHIDGRVANFLITIKNSRWKIAMHTIIRLVFTFWTDNTALCSTKIIIFIIYEFIFYYRSKKHFLWKMSPHISMIMWESSPNAVLHWTQICFVQSVRLNNFLQFFGGQVSHWHSSPLKKLK